MRQLWAITCRETRAFFTSAQGPVIAAGFLVLTGLFYYLFVRGYADMSLATVRSGRPVFLNLHAGIFHRLYGDVVLFLLFLMPAVTMRLLSSEYRSRRYDLLASWPVPPWRWVTGKWLSAVAMAGVLLLVSSFYFLLTGVLGRMADPAVVPHWQPLVTSLLGLILLAGAVAAWGVAASALTAHQAGAYFLGFAISLGLFLVGQLEPYLPGPLGTVARGLALDQHFLRFAGGVIDSRDIVYYLGLIAVGLAVAAAALSQRRLAVRRRLGPWTSVLIVLAIVVFVQLVAMRRPLRADLTPDRLYSLAPQTEQVLAALDEPGAGADEVEVLAFYQSIDGARQSIQALLQSFADQSSRVRFEVLDPDANPGRTQEYGVGVTRSVVVSAGDRQRLLLEPDEGQLASAIYRVATDTRPVIYWLLGHGEARIDLEETGGATQLATALADAGYAVRPLVLADRGALPADADLVIWAGPKLEPVPDDLTLLDAFLRRGGAMACFFGPDTPERVREWTLGYNIIQQNNVIVAPGRGGARAGVDLRTLAVTEGYGDHPAVRPLQAVTTTFPLVQTLRPVQREMAGISGNVILFTGPDSWSESDPSYRYSGMPGYDPPDDVAGPLPFGVALQVAPVDSTAHGPGRLALIGSSAFVTNANVGLYGNRDLALNLVGWLVEEEELLGIRGRRTSFQPLLLDDQTKEWLGWIAVLAWPALVGLAWFGLVQYRQWRH
jgi:ABC-type transport system involved in multi-copper enzyme maturation permease subunit